MATAARARPLRVLTEAPLCAETRLALQRGPLTGNELYFVRSNFPWPAGWPGLRIGGAVARKLSPALAELDRLPTRELVVTMECAGNGRAFLDPPVAGEQWELGAVSTATWTGVALATLLDEAGVRADAVEVAFEGADGFVRSLPIAAARHPDALLATSMNGSPLPLAHGGPLRLVVPGWYGMASVKWLSAVMVLTEPFDGHFQVERYVIDGRPVREIKVRAVVTHPAEGSTVSGPRVRLAGYAWSGSGGIEYVEVSDDSGATWVRADLAGATGLYGWTAWKLEWTPRRKGGVRLLVRARDRAGNLQPLRQAWNPLGYCNNATVPHRITVS